MTLYVPKTEVINGTGSGAVAILMTLNAPSLVITLPPTVITPDTAEIMSALKIVNGGSWYQIEPYVQYKTTYSSTDMSSTGAKQVVGTSEVWVSTDTGANWTEVSPASGQDWDCVKISQDGNHIWASDRDDSGRLWQSTDNGANWTERRPAGTDSNLTWVSDCSSDGSTVIAGCGYNRLWISTDSGASWTEAQPGGATNLFWYDVRVSNDGQDMVAAVNNGRIYTSSNAGSTWTETTPIGAANESWKRVWMSPDASVLIAWEGNARQYVSTNFGTSWAETRPTGDNNVYTQHYGSNTDGSIIYSSGQSAGPSRVMKSTDNGVSWTDVQPDGGDVDRYWGPVAVDADGSVVIAGITYQGSLYLSTDSGANFIDAEAAYQLDQEYSKVKISGDGSTLIAASGMMGLLGVRFNLAWLQIPFGD